LLHDSLKSLCLVDKSWRDIAGAPLWHKLSTDLCEGARNFDALLLSPSGGFLDHVRILNILNSCVPRCQLNTKLLQLIALLPRGCLSKFTVEEEIERRTLGILIKQQSNLRELSAPVFDSLGRIGPPGPGFVARNLAKMTNLTIFASAEQAGYDSWFPHMPSLETLTVRGELSKQDVRSGHWRSEQKLQIRTLNLRNVYFTAYSGAIDAWADLTCLKELEFEDCKDMAMMLGGLADAYLGTEHDGLKSLDIFEQSDTPWISDLECFLEVISGLGYLSVSASTNEKINPAFICDHGPTLRYLVIEPLNKWNVSVWTGDGIVDHIYDDTDLRCLAKECPLVEEFGTSLPQIDFETWPYTEPFVWHPETARSPRERSLMASLVSRSDRVKIYKLTRHQDALATFPKLRVIRLTQPPIIVLDDGPEDLYRERQWRYQQFAEQILQYLAKKKSSVELLAFSPTVDQDYVGEMDTNGHVWPHYYYLRGVSTTILPKTKHKTQTVAVPVKMSDIAQYMEQPKILAERNFRE
jgi:hypothetical protein